jgi:N-acetylmuramoyl-L-alanine amidase
MIRKVFQLGIPAVLVVAAGLAPAASTELRGIHLSATPEAAQVTLDLTDTASQKVFTLENPDRAVIDLGHTRLASGVRVPAGSGIVTGVRTGAQPGDKLRVVLQLKSAVPTHSAWTQAADGGGRQLVITLGESTVADADAAPKVVRAAHAPVDSDRDVIVAVDPGHGGQDPGAIGRGGTREKDVTLAIARALARRINTEQGMRAILTRDRDEFLTLRDRIRRARVAKADMFISVHADSIANRSISGASVYVLSERGASNEAARWLAERENEADLMGGVKLDDKDNTLASVLLDLSQSANISASMTAAERVLASLDGVGQVRKSQVQQAGFVVLKSPDIPSMLIETAYISNPVEELRLKSTGQQAKLADAIFSGVRRYFEENPPAGTRFAQARRSTVASVAAAAQAASP